MGIKVIVNGAKGRMGSLAVQAITAAKHLACVAALSKEDDLEQAIHATGAEVVLDLTTANSVFSNSQKIINAGAYPVIGTSGLLPEQIMELKQLAQQKNIGGLIVPNFSIGAVLMMQFARQAAAYFSEVEIIEKHHQGKLDAPSGTAIKTAELIAESRCQSPNQRQEKVTIPGARGGMVREIPIHSLRLPGYLAAQEVIFGGNSETLRLCHDTSHRDCFMPGIILACQKVKELDQLQYGLEFVLN